jgi:hypothetical protein
MDILAILREGVEISRKNYILFIPMLAVMLLLLFSSFILIGSGMFAMYLTGSMIHLPGVKVSRYGAVTLGVFILSLLAIVLYLFAHGMTIAMAKEVIERGTTSLNRGIAVTMDRFGPLLGASTLVGLTVAAGFMLFVIPGILASLFFMLTFVAVIVENLDAVKAMKRSYGVVRSRLHDSVILFVALIVIGLALGVVNGVFTAIPLIGQLLSMALAAMYGGYVSIVVVRGYKELTSPATRVNP